jgi:hypothetical protein
MADQPIDERIEAAIRGELDRRGSGKTICASEVARRVDADGWRALMPRVQNAVRRLAHGGEVEVLQRGRRVDPSDAKGPIRVRKPGG